jgi:hypothetical protein
VIRRWRAEAACDAVYAKVRPALDRLLITTVTKGLGPDGLARYPDSGRLFLADVGASGLPATPWAGFD